MRNCKYKITFEEFLVSQTFTLRKLGFVNPFLLRNPNVLKPGKALIVQTVEPPPPLTICF
jgi:hypothetical protein